MSPVLRAPFPWQENGSGKRIGNRLSLPWVQKLESRQARNPFAIHTLQTLFNVMVVGEESV
jgi:hypothetical protein